MADYAEGTKAQDASGNVIVFQGGQWVPQGAGSQSNAETGAQVAQGAIAGAQQGATGIANIPGDLTPMALAGKGATALAGALGVPQVAAPDTWAGKVGEFIGGAAIGGAPGAMRGGGRSVLSALHHPIESGAAMADNIAASLETGGPGRVLKGYLTPDQIKSPLLKSQEMGLKATTDAELTAAKQQRWKEDLRGNVSPDTLMAQKQEFTNTIKNEMGITGPENLTPSVIADTLRNEGAAIGNITKASGKPINLGGGFDKIRGIVNDADTTHKAVLGNVLKDLEKDAAKNGGNISADMYQRALTRLDKIGAPGQSSGRVMDSNDIKEVLHDALQKNLTGPELDALKAARYRYKIAKTLDNPGAVGPDGSVNPASFGAKWDKKTGQTLRGKDTIGQAADTFKYLASNEAHAGSTLQRLWSGAIGSAKENPIATGGAVLGGAGFGSLFR